MHAKTPASVLARRGIVTGFGLEGKKLRLTNLHHSVRRDNRCCGTL